jgi:hypothetical protein
MTDPYAPDLRAQAWGAMSEQTERNEDIRRRARAGEPTAALAAEYGISHRRANQIVARTEAPRRRKCPTCGRFHTRMAA